LSAARTWPWGEKSPTCAHADMWQCLPKKPKPAGWNPGDVSVYGVLGLAGNVREWTKDGYSTSRRRTSLSSGTFNHTGFR